MSYSYQQILDESSKMRKENDMLKQRVKRPLFSISHLVIKIEELQKKCADLSTVNEMLLEQNAKYRHVLNSSQPPPPAVPMEAQVMPILWRFYKPFQRISTLILMESQVCKFTPPR